MPSIQHKYQEDQLKNYFINTFPDINNASKYDLFGEQWVSNFNEKQKKINLNGSEPDLVVADTNKKFIYLGEAKVINDFSSDHSRFLTGGQYQLMNYLTWLSDDTKCKYEYRFILYSVPIYVKHAMIDCLRKLNKKLPTKVDFDVICHYEKV